MATTDVPAAVTVLEVALDRIAADPGQPRTWIDPAGLETLAASIAAAGVIQPLLVSHHPDLEARRATPYMIVSGERRWRAARLAGLAAVPVVVHARWLAAAGCRSTTAPPRSPAPWRSRARGRKTSPGAIARAAPGSRTTSSSPPPPARPATSWPRGC